MASGDKFTSWQLICECNFSRLSGGTAAAAAEIKEGSGLTIPPVSFVIRKVLKSHNELPTNHARDNNASDVRAPGDRAISLANR